MQSDDIKSACFIQSEFHVQFVINGVISANIIVTESLFKPSLNINLSQSRNSVLAKSEQESSMAAIVAFEETERILIRHYVCVCFEFKH